VAATVDAAGKVTAVKTLEGNKTLGAAVEEAVAKWKFAPGAGTATVEVTMSFGAN